MCAHLLYQSALYGATNMKPYIKITLESAEAKVRLILVRRSTASKDSNSSRSTSAFEQWQHKESYDKT